MFSFFCREKIVQSTTLQRFDFSHSFYKYFDWTIMVQFTVHCCVYSLYYFLFVFFASSITLDFFFRFKIFYLKIFINFWDDNSLQFNFRFLNFNWKMLPLRCFCFEWIIFRPLNFFFASFSIRKQRTYLYFC